MSYNFTFSVVIIARGEREKNDYFMYLSTSTIFDISYSIYLRLRLRYGDVVVRCLIHYTIQCGTYISATS